MRKCRKGIVAGFKGLVYFTAIVCFAVSAGAFTEARAANEAPNVAPDFTLSDQHGHSFTLARHRGHPVVLFFGYTHCPDVCPTILANLKSARAAIGPAGSDIVVALITVDAARDTRAELGQFVSAFDPSFLGLTGTSAQLKSVYRDYHVRYVKQAEGPGGYLVSHTAFVYYIGRDGRVHGFGTWSDPQDILREDLKSISERSRPSARGAPSTPVARRLHHKTIALSALRSCSSCWSNGRFSVTFRRYEIFSDSKRLAN